MSHTVADTALKHRAPVVHRMTDAHRQRVETEMAPTIADWLTKNNLVYRRTWDLSRLLNPDIQIQASASIDPDEDFAREPVEALMTTYSNIQFLTEVMRAERRRGIQNHWTYDLPRHSALVRAIDAETQIGIWMERVIRVRADIKHAAE